MNVIRAIFGAKGQLVAGIVTMAVVAVAWFYGTTLRGEALLRFLFHISMAALALAAYAIIATALGYRATERVEEHIINIKEGNDE